MNKFQSTFFSFYISGRSTDSPHSGYKATSSARHEQTNQIYWEQEKTLSPGAGKLTNSAVFRCN